MSSLFRSALAFALASSFVVAAVAPVRADVVGTVRGTLVRTDRRPVPRALVTLRGERTTLTAETGGDGRFTFARVPFGRYELTAPTPDGVADATVDVASGAVVDVALAPLAQIGRSAATAHGVRGTPTSENAYGPRQLASMPGNANLAHIVETVPGVVTFSYGEPVAHGFHGLTYELDGAPLPQSTSANFAQLVDPRDVSAIEIFTGAIPAEFGGSRMGAVVNVASSLASSGQRPGGALSAGAGAPGAGEGRLVEHLNAGAARIGLALNADDTLRGLDTPARDALHDASSTANGFLRIAVPFGERDRLAADLSTQHAGFRIPINTNPNDPLATVVSPAATDDVQLEDSRFASLSFTHVSNDGNGFAQIVPWARYDRIRYLGDVANDLLAYQVNDGSARRQNALRQDRAGSYAGLRASAYRTGTHHAVKAGLDLAVENFRSSLTLFCAPGNCLAGVFTDAAAQRGTQSGFYVQDAWTPNARLAIDAGLRYDHSTGYVGSAQLSPRLGINQEIGRGTILHAYYGRFYAAPSLEDTRRDAIVTQTAANQPAVYDLQPERDGYLELGIARTFRGGVRAYVNAFDRTAVNVLDTTNLLNTPLFVVFNNAIGRDRGIELRVDRASAATDAGLSLTWSRAQAGGVSGGTFLFAAPGDLTLQPEDHDQTWAGNAFATRRFGAGLRTYATLQAEYGTGFPVEFENGEGRLPAHWTVNLALGRGAASRGGVGWGLDVQNLFDHRYPIKVNNGFNTTQWNAPRSVMLRATLPW